MTKKRADDRNPKFVWQDAFSASGLTGNVGLIGLVMSLRDNGDGQGFFMSQRRLSDLTGLSERTVQTCVAKLKETGWITVTRRGGNQGGQARATWYKLTFPDASQPAAEDAQPADGSTQPEAGFDLVDQTPLDPPQVDLSTLEAGAVVSGELVRRLGPSDQEVFMPAFEGEDMWSYEPSMRCQPPSPTTKPDTGPVTAGLTPRQERTRRDMHNRMLREEGLDENGEPPSKKGPSSSFRRRS